MHGSTRYGWPPQTGFQASTNVSYQRQLWKRPAYPDYKCSCRLLDRLGRERKHVSRHLDAKRLRSLKVDSEHELVRLHDRQLGGLFSLEDEGRVGADLTMRVREVGTIAHQPAGGHELSVPVSRR